MPNTIPFVWIEPDGLEPMCHAYFRREFLLAGPVSGAQIHLYADTNYHLFVNGEFAGYGPARAYPEFPEYDTYDLAPLLRAGENVVAVHVLHVGLPTFHNLPGRAGLAAWGSAAAEGEQIDFSTAQDWLCRKATGYDQTMAVYSFAIGPGQSFDERQEPPGWNQAPRPEEEWQAAVPLTEQESWGELRPRSIPPLTQDEKLPKTLLGAWAHDDNEEIVSFRLNEPATTYADRQRATKGFACTYIYSPRAQQVTVGTFWGECFLNGKPFEQQAEKSDQMLRADAILDFSEGWNFFFGSYGMVNRIWEMHLAVPKSAGLVFSADRKEDSETAFLTAGPLPREEADSILALCPPDSPDTLPALSGLWQPQPRLPYAASPQKGLAWAKFDSPLPIPPYQAGDIAIPADTDASLIFDMGLEQLGRIFIEFDAPRGTVLDIGTAEDLRLDRPNYGKNILMSTGERQIARGGASRMETFHPRGFRYLQVGISCHAGPVAIKKVGVVSQAYPYRKAGAFECSDPFFNTLWDYGWNTLRLCSEDVITDCPSRERTLYAGDLLPETASILVTTGDLRLPRRCLEIFLQSASPESGWLQSMAPMRRDRHPHSDYPLLALVTTDWYCRVTGDMDFARRAEPIFRRMLDSLRENRNEQGLFITVDGLFIDWIDMTKTGEVCAFYTLIARAWEAWASLLTLLGQEAEAETARGLQREAARIVSERFWDESAGAFADTVQDGNQENSHYIASSAWPVMYGLTSPAQDTRIAAHIRRVLADFDPSRDSKFTSSYGAFYLLGALYEMGDAGYAEDCIRHLWADMVLHPTGTLWENFFPGTSLVHAWSTAPTYYLSTHVLGVRLGFPDHTELDTILIAPESETINWARGIVPHPRGPVSVAWAVRGERLVLDYEAPIGVSVTVAPKGRLSRMALWVNGSKA